MHGISTMLQKVFGWNLLGFILITFWFFCRNGASRSGLYCAISLLLERKEQDQEIDVFQTVKTIRNNRPQFIEDKVKLNIIWKYVIKYWWFFSIRHTAFLHKNEKILLEEDVGIFCKFPLLKLYWICTNERFQYVILQPIWIYWDCHIWWKDEITMP